jgi:hypothetical protein
MKECCLKLFPARTGCHCYEVGGRTIFTCNGHAILIQLTHVAIRASEAGWQYNTLTNLMWIEIVNLECISKALIKLRSNGSLVSS